MKKKSQTKKIEKLMENNALTETGLLCSEKIF